MMAAVVFVISQIFKKGLEVQSENDLTVLAMSIVVNLDIMIAKRKMSLNELSEKADITLSNLSILQKAKAIRFSMLESICKALDCQPGDLIEFKEKRF